MAIIKIKNTDGIWESIDTAGALKYIEQDLTLEQQAQALLNLGLGLATEEKDGLFSKTDKAILNTIAGADTLPHLTDDGVLVFASKTDSLINAAEVGM